MIQAMIDKLLESGTPFRMVGGAGDLANVKDRPTTSPAAFVYVAADQSLPNERATGRVLQRSEIEIGVVIVASNLSATNNAAAAADIEALKAYVRAQLIGFQPGGDTEPLEHHAGELQQAIGGTVWFEDIYRTATYLQES
ncbi:phage tail terminator protein [Rhizobium halophytocola]|nr:hypothetical protein [Rhizobium halophytocola]